MASGNQGGLHRTAFYKNLRLGRDLKEAGPGRENSLRKEMEYKRAWKGQMFYPRPHRLMDVRVTLELNVQ